MCSVDDSSNDPFPLDSGVGSGPRSLDHSYDAGFVGGRRSTRSRTTTTTAGGKSLRRRDASADAVMGTRYPLLFFFSFE